MTFCNVIIFILSGEYEWLYSEHSTESCRNANYTSLIQPFLPVNLRMNFLRISLCLKSPLWLINHKYEVEFQDFFIRISLTQSKNIVVK